MDGANEEDLGPRLVEQVFELWVEPELANRGLELDRSEVTKVVVELAPGKPAHVSVNEDAGLVAEVRATGPIRAGQPVTWDDFDEILRVWPEEVGPDSGWVCFARIGGALAVAFDFRRNRLRARSLLKLADEYLEVARQALSMDRERPAVECAFTSAELAVVAQMLVVGHDDPPRDHQVKRRWLTNWTQLGNAPPDHGRTLADLAGRRRAARYGEGSWTLSRQHLEAQLATVEEMVRHAEHQVGDDPAQAS